MSERTILDWWPAREDVPVLVGLRLGLHEDSLSRWLGVEPQALCAALRRLEAQSLAVPPIARGEKWRCSKVGLSIAEPALRRLQDTGELSRIARAYEARCGRG
jgi:hypothetical protein